MKRAALSVLALAAVSLAACGKKEAAKPAEQSLTVSTARVAMRDLQGGLTASGVLVSREEAAVSSELSGYRVARVYVEEGAHVRAGQPLALLDDTLLRAQIEQSQANVQLQEVAAAKADAEAKRVEGLDSAGVLSEEAIAERRLGARTAHAQLAVAKAQLNDLKTRQARMTITAPVSGVVLERAVRPGDASSPSTVMFRMARDNLVELDAEIPEASLGKVHVNERAQVVLPAGGKVPGVVRLVSPRVDPQTKLAKARIALPVRPDLRPGGYAQVVFSDAARPVPAVPEAALRFDTNGASVMTVDANNRVKRQTVKTGERSGGYVELIQGPPVGSRVTLGGSAFVTDGDKVQTVEAPSASGSGR